MNRKDKILLEDYVTEYRKRRAVLQGEIKLLEQLVNTAKEEKLQYDGMLARIEALGTIIRADDELCQALRRYLEEPSTV